LPAALYIVATPIGNLDDLSPRAAASLAAASLIACEDTRQTAKLLTHLSIRPPMVTFHEHNERDRIPELIHRLKSGESIALVSDAGTPLISDPGYRLVSAASAEGIPVIPIPGPCAAVAALSASGLPTDSFYFGGFLHPKSSRRRTQLEALRDLPSTLIFYEAPHRIVETLADVEAMLGHRDTVLAREVTKIHEEFLRGAPQDLLRILRGRPAIKGEFTLLIAKADEAQASTDDSSLLDAVHALESQGLSRMDAIKRVSRERGVPKRDVYRLLNS
jgi:16S rRNA (cytidine1402-2'-O)-methyltransferase